MKIGECVRVGVMRKVSIRIFGKQIFQSFFLEYIQLLYLSTNCNILLLFSFCPAELESVEIFKISLSVFELFRK